MWTCLTSEGWCWRRPVHTETPQRPERQLEPATLCTSRATGSTEPPSLQSNTYRQETQTIKHVESRCWFPIKTQNNCNPTRRPKQDGCPHSLDVGVWLLFKQKRPLSPALWQLLLLLLLKITNLKREQIFYVECLINITVLLKCYIVHILTF